MDPSNVHGCIILRAGVKSDVIFLLKEIVLSLRLPETGHQHVRFTVKSLCVHVVLCASPMHAAHLYCTTAWGPEKYMLEAPFVKRIVHHIYILLNPLIEYTSSLFLQLNN